MNQDMASTLTVLAVFAVMLTGFGFLVWMGFRAGRKGRRAWPDDE